MRQSTATYISSFVPHFPQSATVQQGRRADAFRSRATVAGRHRSETIDACGRSDVRIQPREPSGARVVMQPLPLSDPVHAREQGHVVALTRHAVGECWDAGGYPGMLEYSESPCDELDVSEIPCVRDCYQ